MATRSFICIELSEEDKKLFNTTEQYLGVYCHYYGSVIGGVGETLLRSYNSYKKAIRLIKNGAIRTLGDFIKDSHFLYKDHRARLYLDAVFFSDNDIKTVFDAIIGYLYIYKSDGWHWYTPCGRIRWRHMGLIKDMAYFKGSLIK